MKKMTKLTKALGENLGETAEGLAKFCLGGSCAYLTVIAASLGCKILLVNVILAIMIGILFRMPKQKSKTI